MSCRLLIPRLFIYMKEILNLLFVSVCNGKIEFFSKLLLLHYIYISIHTLPRFKLWFLNIYERGVLKFQKFSFIIEKAEQSTKQNQKKRGEEFVVVVVVEYI